ncbi:unnamed protein product [Lactuca virosa]|uniref:Uncharacterized protein n=1 Tax=Lactuca virosa TaxID=75947 RepID=A0AAU9P3I7_9ASTR|nr:unnamed protein product [Lactuca virosa]
MEIFSIIDVVSPSFVVSIRVLHNPLKHMFYRLHRYSHSHHLHRPPLEQNWQINTHISSMKNFEEEGIHGVGCSRSLTYNIFHKEARRRNDFVDCDLEKVNLVYTVCRTFKNPTGLMKLSTIQCERRPPKSSRNLGYSSVYKVFLSVISQIRVSFVHQRVFGPKTPHLETKQEMMVMRISRSSFFGVDALLY